MKRIILVLMTLFTSFCTSAQKINGQWRGVFDSKGDIVLSGSNSTEYVLELEISGTRVSGFSYSYFQGRRYYVICKLDGTYNKNNRSIKVTETERIKGNTPPDFTDCLQVHYLTYSKEENLEKLSGRWETAPGQRGGCGDGSTALTRRTLTNSLANYNKSKTADTTKKELVKKDNKTTPVAKATVPATKKPAAENKIPATAKNTAAAKPKTTTPANSTKKDTKTTVTTPPVVKAAPEKNEVKVTAPAIPKPDLNNKINPVAGFEKRNTELLKTIQIENETFKVDLYDNGEVDGDSVSLFYNGKLLVSNKRLSEKPISLTLDATNSKAINELTMYAENLGEIPPNTAVMVVTDGDKRYEVRIASDYKKSGTIHFVHTPKTQ
jgi:hypothetical protein